MGFFLLPYYQVSYRSYRSGDFVLGIDQAVTSKDYFSTNLHSPELLCLAFPSGNWRYLEIPVCSWCLGSIPSISVFQGPPAKPKLHITASYHERLISLSLTAASQDIHAPQSWSTAVATAPWILLAPDHTAACSTSPVTSLRDVSRSADVHTTT